jgi:Protein of unknown function (DUF732)
VPLSTALSNKDVWRLLLRATLIAAAIALLSFAALAHADTGNESRYVSDVQALGVAENPHGILADGYRVCDLLNGGASPTAVAGMIYANSQQSEGSRGVTLDIAKQMVDAAIGDLC